MEVRGRHYTLKSFDDMSGATWKLLARNLESLADDATRFRSVAAAQIQLLAPSARRPMRQWTDLELMDAFIQTQTHLSELMQAGTFLMRRFSGAAEKIKTHFAERDQSAEMIHFIR